MDFKLNFNITSIINSLIINFLVQGQLVADENGSNEPLRRYSQKTLVIVLPGDLTVFDIGKN